VPEEDNLSEVEAEDEGDEEAADTSKASGPAAAAKKRFEGVVPKEDNLSEVEAEDDDEE